MFLYGGNDGNNTIVPLDTAGYAQYAAVRTAASGIQLAQAALLPIQPASLGTPFGLHPACAELQTLFNQRKLAVLANVGTLVQPTSKSQYNAGQVPLSLYSHSDQQAQWQSSVSDGVVGAPAGADASPTSWHRSTPASGFPVVTSLGGAMLFATGKTTSSRSPFRRPERSRLRATTAAPSSSARLAALKQFLAAGSTQPVRGRGQRYRRARRSRCRPR